VVYSIPFYRSDPPQVISETEARTVCTVYKQYYVVSVCPFPFRLVKWLNSAIKKIGVLIGKGNWGISYVNYCDYTRCSTRYRIRHFFNNFTTNEDIATKFEADLPHCVRNVKEKNVLLFKFRWNIFICVIIIKGMPDLVKSGTLCIMFYIFEKRINQGW
jgi:hypothetical protein